MKNRVFKVLSLFILLAVLFIPTSVSAASQQYWKKTTNYTSATTSGTYYLGPSTAYTRFYNTFIHQITDGSKKYLAYCLDPNWSSPQGGSGSISTLSSSTKLTHKNGTALTDNELELLKNIMAAGKQQGNYVSGEQFTGASKSEMRYYLATQILIWEVMSGGRYDYEPSHVTVPSGQKSTYDFVKTDKELLERYTTTLEIAESLSDSGKPAGFGKKYILHWNDAKSKYISSGNIEVGSYNYDKNNADITVTKSNGSAKITTTKELTSYTKLNFSYKFGMTLDSSNNFKWFVFNASGTNQRMLLAYYQGSNTANLSVKTESGIFKINKKDKTTGAGLKGAVFTMYKCSSTRTNCKKVQTIDMKDKTTSDAIKITKSGIYKFVESTVPGGYEKLKDFFVKLTITDDGNVKATVDASDKDYIKVAAYNSTRYMHILASNDTKSFTISKVDGSDNKTKVNGATFQIKDSKGKVVKFTKLAEGSFEYSTSGTVTNLVASKLSSYKIKGLPVGEYTLEETAVPRPYELSSNESERQTKFKIDKTNYLQVYNTSKKKYITATTATITVKNYTKSFKISKIDGQDNKTAIKGTTFKIKTATGAVVKFDKEEEGSYVYNPNGSVTNLVAEDLSTYFITALPVGEYILEEIATTNEYILPAKVSDRQTKFKIDANDYLQTLDSNNKYVKNTKVTITVKNYKTKVTIIKTASGKSLAGVTFELYDENKTQKISMVKVDGIFHYNGTATSSDMITDSKGKIVLSGLPEGTYYLKEVSLPDGATAAIDPNNQWRKIVVELGPKSNQMTETISNTQGDFCFYKMDEDGNYLDKGTFALQVYNEETSKFEDVALIKNKDNNFEIDTTGKGSYKFTPVSGGQTCFVNLGTRGRYKVVELEAPEGFLLPSNQSDLEAEISINEYGYASGDAVIINKKVTTGKGAEAQAELVVGVSTGMDRINYVYIIGGIVLVLGTLIFVKKKMDKK